MERVAVYYRVHKQATIPKTVLICTPETLHVPSTPPDAVLIACNVNTPFEVVRQGYITNAVGFGESPGVDDVAVRMFHASLTDHYGFTMLLNDEPVAAGMYDSLLDGVTELLGITTLPAYQRRGYGAWLTAKITEHAFAHNVNLAFLVPVDESSSRVYERVGYRPLVSG